MALEIGGQVDPGTAGAPGSKAALFLMAEAAFVSVKLLFHAPCRYNIAFYHGFVKLQQNLLDMESQT